MWLGLWLGLWLRLGLGLARVSEVTGAAAVYEKGTRMMMAAKKLRVAFVTRSAAAEVWLGSGRLSMMVLIEPDMPRAAVAARMRASYTLASSAGSACMLVELKASVVMPGWVRGRVRGRGEGEGEGQG